MSNAFRTSLFKPDRTTKAALKRGAKKIRGAYKRLTSQPERSHESSAKRRTEWLPASQYHHMRSIKTE